MHAYSSRSQRIDFACGFFHFCWIDLIVLIVGIVLLLVNLGPSALAGIAFFALIAPTQGRIMKAFPRLTLSSFESEARCLSGIPHRKSRIAYAECD